MIVRGLLSIVEIFFGIFELYRRCQGCSREPRIGSYLLPQQCMLAPDALEERIQRFKVCKSLKFVVQIIAHPGVCVLVARHAA